MIEDLYQKDNGVQYHSAVHDYPEEAKIWIANLRKEKIQKHITKNSSVFEYGAGFGFNIREITAQRKLAYDIASHLKDQYNDTDVEFTDSLNTVNEEKFDSIICHHVLEHVPTPTKTLQDINNRLNVNGSFLLYIPMEHGSRYNRVKPDDKDHHIYSWNFQTISNLVTFSGFRVISVSKNRFGYDFISSRITKRLWLGEKTYRIIRVLLNLIRPVYEIEVVAKKVAPKNV